MAEINDIIMTDRTIEIVHPATKEPLGISVTIEAMDSDATKAIRRKIIDERQRLEQRGKYLKADEIEENMNNLCFAVMRGWNWGKDKNGEQNTFNGEVPEFNRRNVMAIFAAKPWFRAQINDAANEEKDFFTDYKRN